MHDVNLPVLVRFNLEDSHLHVKETGEACMYLTQISLKTKTIYELQNFHVRNFIAKLLLTANM